MAEIKHHGFVYLDFNYMNERFTVEEYCIDKYGLYHNGTFVTDLHTPYESEAYSAASKYMLTYHR